MGSEHSINVKPKETCGPGQGIHAVSGEPKTILYDADSYLVHQMSNPHWEYHYHVITSLSELYLYLHFSPWQSRLPSALPLSQFLNEISFNRSQCWILITGSKKIAQHQLNPLTVQRFEQEHHIAIPAQFNMHLDQFGTHVLNEMCEGAFFTILITLNIPTPFHLEAMKGVARRCMGMSHEYTSLLQLIQLFSEYDMQQSLGLFSNQSVSIHTWDALLESIHRYHEHHDPVFFQHFYHDHVTACLKEETHKRRWRTNFHEFKQIQEMDILLKQMQTELKFYSETLSLQFNAEEDLRSTILQQQKTNEERIQRLLKKPLYAMEPVYTELQSWREKFVNLKLRYRPVKGPIFGCTEGTLFDDSADIQSHDTEQVRTLFLGKQKTSIDIQALYEQAHHPDFVSHAHGRTHDTHTERQAFHFAQNEYIHSLSVTTNPVDNTINAITLRSNFEKTILCQPEKNIASPSTFQFSSDAREQIIGFYGYEAEGLSALGALLSPTPEMLLWQSGFPVGAFEYSAEQSILPQFKNRRFTLSVGMKTIDLRKTQLKSFVRCPIVQHIEFEHADQAPVLQAGIATPQTIEIVLQPHETWHHCSGNFLVFHNIQDKENNEIILERILFQTNQRVIGPFGGHAEHTGALERYCQRIPFHFTSLPSYELAGLILSGNSHIFGLCPYYVRNTFHEAHARKASNQF